MLKIKKIVILTLMVFSLLPLLLSMSINIFQLKYKTNQIVTTSFVEKQFQNDFQDLANSQIQQTLRVNIIFALLILLFIMLFWNFANKTFFNPLEELIHSIHSIKLGDYNNRFIYNKNNELGEISSAFNSLIDKIMQESKKKRKETEVLKEKSQRDMLTGLYNKGTTESLIEAFLAHENEEAIHALFVIDIDDFKSINDSLGHLYGDRVLSSISCSMLQLFRNSDIIGRIGGDEFIIFIKALNSEDAIIEKANEIIAMFSQSCNDQLNACLVSGSIGIAVYPRDGKTFTELYTHADKALYQAKDKGKDCYHLFGNINL